jgi:hypothetical protein
MQSLEKAERGFEIRDFGRVVGPLSKQSHSGNWPGWKALSSESDSQPSFISLHLRGSYVTVCGGGMTCLSSNFCINSLIIISNS